MRGLRRDVRGSLRSLGWMSDKRGSLRSLGSEVLLQRSLIIISKLRQVFCMGQAKEGRMQNFDWGITTPKWTYPRYITSTMKSSIQGALWAKIWTIHEIWAILCKNHPKLKMTISQYWVRVEKSNFHKMFGYTRCMGGCIWNFEIWKFL